MAALTTRQASPEHYQQLWITDQNDALYVTKSAICNTIAQYARIQGSVLLVDNKAMAGEPARRETARGRLPGAAVIPVSKPTISHGGHSEERGHCDHWEGGRCFCRNYA